MLPDIHLLWELVLTAAPILVFSSTPALCSRTVLTLSTMIAPLEFCGDFRPFFTITDPDCRHYAAKTAGDRSGSAVQHSALLGVTNPYFEKEYSHWETCIHVPQTFGPTSVPQRRPRRSHTSDTALNEISGGDAMGLESGAGRWVVGERGDRTGKAGRRERRRKRTTHGPRGGGDGGGDDDNDNDDDEGGDKDDDDNSDRGDWSDGSDDDTCAFRMGSSGAFHDDEDGDEDGGFMAGDAVSSDLTTAAPIDRFTVRLPTRPPPPSSSSPSAPSHVGTGAMVSGTALKVHPGNLAGTSAGLGALSLNSAEETDEDVLARTTTAIHGSYTSTAELKSQSRSRGANARTHGMSGRHGGHRGGGVRTLHKGLSDSAATSTPAVGDGNSGGGLSPFGVASAEELKHTKAVIPLRPVRSPHMGGGSGGGSRAIGGNKRSPVLGRTHSRKPQAGVKSSARVFLECDHRLVCTLLKENPQSVRDFIQAGKAVEQSLASLTRTFLIPLDQYVARLMPLKDTISPFKDIPRIGEFNPADFLAHVKEMLSRLRETREGDWLGLYDKFLRSRNFRHWWTKKRTTVANGLTKLYLSTVAEQAPTLIPTLNEVHSIDLLLRVREAKAALKHTSLSSNLASAVDATIELLINNLPSDTRQSMTVAAII
ncbi:hypothetical protein PTSG_12162 [Salpingoeca rosetta]|uniref:UDENN domain-containing protein n=1 Tax=Salpingoeca rosetta (strain ATCC 50818 / BSB-021) TaxID=946362 RepID=F2U8E7_SALR5|nr:uncharacterized protein PTSG_12162 [Salpingoeca rosetta]EGD72655.1 hypothetical protein PTSG_12162 [Salpingoeca rosetta]|eukprot:XP_004994478.1 hypothetical protein PTSG_12162 [Salpingoeca rosetta]